MLHRIIKAEHFCYYWACVDYNKIYFYILLRNWFPAALPDNVPRKTREIINSKNFEIIICLPQVILCVLILLRVITVKSVKIGSQLVQNKKYRKKNARNLQTADKSCFLKVRQYTRQCFP